MRTPGKKLMCFKTRTSCLLGKEVPSKLHSSPQKKSLCKVNQRCTFKPRSLTKRREPRNKLRNGKIVKTLQKNSHLSSGKNQSSGKLLGRKGSYLEQEGDQKTDVGATIGLKKRKRRRRKKIVEKDEACRLQRRARYLLIKIKLEQNLIDAYSRDGWKGQSREKIKPEKELQRAEKQILKCKLGIREAIHQLDLLSSGGRTEDSVKCPDGPAYHEYIFCAKCRSHEALPDNRIILCDGSCNCGFHQKCLDPPLEKGPPRDQGWLCKFCECKTGILEAVNAHLGTCFTVNNGWEDIFKEASTVPIVEETYPNPTEEWPSEDSGDEDYDPQRNEISDSTTDTVENVSDDASSSSDLFFSSVDAKSYIDETNDHPLHEGSNLIKFRNMGTSGLANSLIFDNQSGETSDQEVMSYRRQRKDVDYKKLHDEMFGKDLTENEEQSEDEDWGPQKRKKRRLESDIGFAMTECGGADHCANMFIMEELSCNRKPPRRIPPNAVERLRQVFAENELPSRAIKENLSIQLGIPPEKISKWFRNARYTALRIRKAEFNSQISINDITGRSNRTLRKKLCSNEVTLTDDFYRLPLSSIIRMTKNLRRNCQRKEPMSIPKPLKKQQQKAANAESPDKIQKSITISKVQSPISVKKSLEPELGPRSCQVSSRFTNTVYYRRRVGGMKGKLPLDRTFNTEGRTCSLVDETMRKEQHYLIEMERFFYLENRVRELKKVLQACEENHQSARERHPKEPTVVYVPFAEVKEKT